MCGAHVPKIQAVAMTVLTQPAAASAAETNWSVYGAIKGKGKAAMKHETGDKLVYLYQALRMAKKFDAHYIPEYQPWDDDSSDSDSEGYDSGADDQFPEARAGEGGPFSAQ